MVIVPTILDSVERVRALLAHVEVQALGNLDPHVHFAILSDFRDAPTETHAARRRDPGRGPRGYRGAQLRTWRQGRSDRFFLFHRSASVERAAKASGWDGSASAAKSRSSTACCVVRPIPASSFHVGDLAVLPSVRYCITLDSDTRLPRDVARQLIGIITHPLNRARFDPAVGPRHRRVRHSAAARQRDVPERRRLAVRAALRRAHRRRPVHHCGIRHLPGPFRRRHLHRQRSLRRRRVHCRARGLGAGERAAVPRPVRRSPRARRARVGRGVRRRLSRRACSRTRVGSTAGSGATGRSCSGCFRSCRRATAGSATRCR